MRKLASKYKDWKLHPVTFSFTIKQPGIDSIRETCRVRLLDHYLTRNTSTNVQHQQCITQSIQC